MLEGGTVSTFKLVCVLLSMLGGGTATISILNQECVLMSILDVVQQSPSSTVYVCSCPCLEVAQRYSNNLHLELCMCAHVHAYLHLETCSCQCLEVA